MVAFNRKIAVLFTVAICLGVVNILTAGAMWSYVYRGVLDTLSGWRSTGDTTTQPQTNKTEIERYLSERAVHVEAVDCKAVIEGDKEQLEKAYKVEREQAKSIENDTSITLAARTCSSFVQRYGFINDSLTDMEETFPIAFSILTYKDAAQVVFLLRAIYRPQNSYCIHVDKKSRSSFRDAIRAVTDCLPGVFMTSRSIDVRWGAFTVLEPEIVCMQDLWNHSKTWRYFINLTGQEFPLKTNYELVKILKAFNGANDVHGFDPNSAFQGRWRRRLPAPHNLTVYAGGVQVTLSRGFVDFILHNRTAQDFLNWTRRIGHPDESFFNTLNYNPQLRVPGGFKGSLKEKNAQRLIPFLSRRKNWVKTSGVPCPGRKVVRQLCIFSALDIPFLSKQPHLFANKFYQDYSRVALGCLAEDIFNRTRDETLGRRDFNVSYYENIPKIKDKLTF
ncbi:beta-1,3-galactosyl-O-glycosyl-glycoprotein beta-1,6-N-acetylglucosaminyltransferase 4-like isoform X1 [Littorina saxatilis]